MLIFFIVTYMLILTKDIFTFKNIFRLLIYFSGVIGQYWAMIFAAGGYRVSLFDIDGTQVSRALDFVKEKLKSYEKQGRLRGTTSADHQFQLISGHTDLSECVDEACYIQVSIITPVCRTVKPCTILILSGDSIILWNLS